MIRRHATYFTHIAGSRTFCRVRHVNFLCAMERRVQQFSPGEGDGMEAREWDSGLMHWLQLRFGRDSTVVQLRFEFELTLANYVAL